MPADRSRRRSARSGRGPAEGASSATREFPRDVDFERLKPDPTIPMQPPPSAEGERIDPETLLKLLWKKAGADANSKGIALPESKSDGDPLVAFELDVTAEEFLKNYAHLKRPLDIEVSGDWKVVSSDGIILALHLTNILGFLLNDSSKGLEEAERMGAWIEREILANGGAPRAATKSRHASYLRKPDPRKGATHLFAWAPAGHEEPAQIRASKDMSAEYVSRLGENISIAIEAVIKTLSIIENAAYQVLVKNWNEKLAGSSFAVKMARTIPSLPHTVLTQPPYRTTHSGATKASSSSTTCPPTLTSTSSTRRSS
ncbi:hypothetical protein BJY59DRAFT_293782 [Rhodotorula toruloides]